MANKTIHELTLASTVSSDYQFAVYDVDGNTTKKATAEQILNTSDLLYADDEATPTGEVDFSSQDTSLSPSSSVSVDLLSGDDSWSARFVKISQMFKNIRFLLGKLGTTDISNVGNGTVTGAIYTLLSNISQLSFNNTRADSTGSGLADFTSFCDTVVAGKMQFFRMRNGTPTSTWNYSIGLILRSTESETVVVMFGYNVDGIAILRKKSGTWDTAWKSITLS